MHKLSIVIAEIANPFDRKRLRGDFSGEDIAMSVPIQPDDHVKTGADQFVGARALDARQ